MNPPNTRDISMAFPSHRVLVADAGSLAQLSAREFRALRVRLERSEPVDSVLKRPSAAGEILVAPVMDAFPDQTAHVVRARGRPVRLVLDLYGGPPPPAQGDRVPLVPLPATPAWSARSPSVKPVPEAPHILQAHAV